MENTKLSVEDQDMVLQSDTVLDAASSSLDPLQSRQEEDESSFTALESLRILDLSGKSLESLSVMLSSQLQALNISDNNFAVLPDELCQLRNLTSLKASQNKLKELPEWIGDLQNLVSLQLSSNDLQDLPASFRKLQSLKELDLSKNRFFKIPDSLQVACISLQHINLSHNSIISWLFYPASVSSLQTLCLAQNSIISVPPWLYDGRAYRMISLDLSLNPVFCQAPKLSQVVPKSYFTQLNLSNCFLAQKDLKFVGQFPNITHLDLSNHFQKSETVYENIVREIDLSALQFRTSLIHLSLYSVSLTDLPNDIEELVSLEVLDCRNNILYVLPNSVCKLSRLRICLLSDNSLCELPDKFGELTSLEELRLEGNNLTSLPESFGNLQNLRWLDLYGNHIKEVPNQLEKLIDNLQGLDFEFNLSPLYSDQNGSDNDVTLLSRDKYESLLEKMRSYLVPLNGSESRSSTGVRIVSPIVRGIGCRPPISDASSYTTDSDRSSDTNSECERRSPTPAYEEDDLDWDTALSDTDNFDSDAFSSRTKAVELHVVAIPHYITERHKFCPSDMHADRIRQSVISFTDAPKDGQFDDA